MYKSVFIFLFFSISLFSQEIPLNSSNFDNYIKEVYHDKADLLVFSNPKEIKKKKEILNRIFIINDVEEKKKEYYDFETLYIVNTYNKSLKQSFPEKLNPEEFNPFLYKMNTFSNKAIYYHYSKSNQLVKIYPISK